MRREGRDCCFKEISFQIQWMGQIENTREGVMMGESQEKRTCECERPTSLVLVPAD